MTAVTPTLARRLERLHQKPVEVIFNGFDPNDYPADPPPNPGFDLTYVGSLLWPRQDPTPLLQAIALLQDRSDLDLDALGFRAHFLGSTPAGVPKVARQHGVDHHLRFAPTVSHFESLARQAASGALLLLSWNDPSTDVVLAKLFEYLGAGRPVLAVGPPSPTMSKILTECGMDDFSADPTTLAARLEGWLRNYHETGQLPSRTTAAAGAYTRQAQARRLADWLTNRVEARDRRR